MKAALTGLPCTLGVVILIEAVLFLMPGARHDCSKTHMPDVLRLVLGWGEIIGSLLLLIPRTAARGAWILAGTFVLAIMVPLLRCPMSANSPSTRRRPGQSPWARVIRARASLAMTHQEIIQRFERDAVAEDSFHHVDHVRLAFAYLCEYPVLPALERFATALKRFAAARGKAQLYHETITHAYFFLIRERMAGSQGADWDEFARQNPDLLVWQDGILNRYHRETTLKSELARTVFVFPDKCC